MYRTTQRAERLAFLAADFMRAAFDPATGPVKLQILPLADDELQNIDRLLKQVHALGEACDTLRSAKLSPRVMNEVYRAMYRSIVQTIDVMAAHTIKTVGEKYAASLVPAKAHKISNADGFAGMGAPNLANLFVPKPG